MSLDILDAMDVPGADIVLEGRETTLARETARISLALEPELARIRPDWVVVIGDVTSTLAAALTARQMGLRVAHVEAGLRSGDHRMPEEMNRIVVDHLSDLLFASEEAGVANLKQEGIPEERLCFAGNILMDALEYVLPKSRSLTGNSRETGPVPEGSDFALFTFHRPENVDTKPALARVVELLSRVSRHLPVLFSLHPRTRQRLEEFHLLSRLLALEQVHLLPPVNYPEWIKLVSKARFVGTDSGGMQEETTYLGVPCLTFRENTERPATVRYGTNTLISNLCPATTERQIEVILAGNYRPGTRPPLWDGRAAERIAALLTGARKLEHI